jgi:predicted DNA-binding protein
MEVHLKPETESRLKNLSAATGRDPDDLVEDAMAGYLAELAQTREMLDARTTILNAGK